MRVLLINPAMNMEKLGRFAGLLEPMPCIGLAYIAAALEQHGCHVRAIDMFAEKLSAEEVMAKTERFNPDMVGFTVLTPSAPICSQISQMIRARLPQVRVIWGGIHAEVFAQDIVGCGDADFAVHHDGEETVCEVVDLLGAGDDDFSSVKGLTWKTVDGEVVTNPARRLVQDLDSLPYPAWHLFPIHRYGLLPFADFAKPVLTMTGSRGCPYRCDYCSLIHTGGGTYRRRDPIKLVDEYEYMVDRFGVRQIGFVDPIFPLSTKDLKPFCEELVSRGLDKKCHWLSETRCDRMDKETAELMYRGGCRRVLFGIESGSDMLLAGVNKKITTSKVRDGVANAHAAGLQTVGLFMIGMPGETPEMTEQTIDFSIELGLDFAKYAITVPFRGSKLFADRWQKTLFRDDWENYTTFNPDPDNLIYSPPGYDPTLLIKMQAVGLRRFYMRPSQLKRQIMELKTLSPKVMLYGLYGMAV